MKTRIPLFIFLFSIILIGCEKNYPEYDNVPVVEFSSAYTSEDESDKKITFSFMLYDGDGNFGLEDSDTTSPYVDSLQQNFYATPFYVQNNKEVQLPYSFSYRIPRLRNEGQTKFIKAEVSINMTLAKSVFPYDTVFFTYFVYDRTLNKSNIDTSALIIFRK